MTSDSTISPKLIGTWRWRKKARFLSGRREDIWRTENKRYQTRAPLAITVCFFTKHYVPIRFMAPPFVLVLYSSSFYFACKITIVSFRYIQIFSRCWKGGFWLHYEQLHAKKKKKKLSGKNEEEIDQRTLFDWLLHQCNDARDYCYIAFVSRIKSRTWNENWILHVWSIQSTGD